MGRNLYLYLFLFIFVSALQTSASPKAENEEPGSELRKWTTADHKDIPLLQQDFKTPEEVTQACNFCHTEAADQIHKTIHWTWKCDADKTGKMGKGGITLNNF